MRKIKEKVYVLFIVGLFILSFISMNSKAETWKQTNSSDFRQGEAIGVKIENGTLKLDFALMLEWAGIGEASFDFFGRAVSTAGDVNADGYDDVIVSADGNDDGGSAAGKAYVYHGSVGGLSPIPAWSDTGSSSGDVFGRAVSTAGDVNGDGYDDVIIGSPNNDSYANNAGKVDVYYGSTSGLSKASVWNATGESVNSYCGYSVGTPGDVNGDGYDDVIIGAYGYSSSTGRVYVYHGSASGLSGTPDWIVTGENAGDYFGYSVSTAGDVNGDGYDDVIIGAYWNDDAGTKAGKAYIYLGSASGLSATPAWTATGENTDDYFGYSVSTAGDVNADGYDDVIIGAYGNDDAGTYAGKVYLYRGSASGLSATPAWTATGESGGDYFGYSVGTAGDVNKDGYADVIMGAYYNDHADTNAGKAYIYYGSSAGLGSSPSWTDTGESGGDYFGVSVGTAGDVNGDGYDDVIVGAINNDEAGNNAGKAYVYQHDDGPTFNLIEKWSETGESGGNYFGVSVGTAGDVNGDGYDDIIVGAYGNDDAEVDAGKVYVYYGSSSGLSSTPDWTATGENAFDLFGYSVATAGDVNGDGYDDIIVGAPYNDDGGSDAGKAYVYYGSSSGLSSTPDWTETGENAYDCFGRAVCTAGDVNGDGYDDIIVGADGNDDAGNSAGKAYVYYGSSSGLSSTPDWTDTGENTGDLFGRSVATAGDVNKDGYDDIIVGAYYNDDAGFDAGKAYVYHGSSTGLSYAPSWTDIGENVGDYFGNSVASAGDVNKDGYDDIIVGANGNDDAGSIAGKAYVYYGSSSGLSYTPDWTDVGENAGDWFGHSVSTAGDVNGDGYDDIIVGADNNDDAGANAGKAYVYYGSSSGLSSTPDWTDTGENAGDLFGISVASAGDVNGDGYDDIIIGANGNDDAGTSAGKAYMYAYPDYLRHGEFISEAFSVTGEYSVDWRYIKWNPKIQPEETNVKFQIGTSNDGGNWNFYGPDGTSNTYFSALRGSSIPISLNGKYWCYKAILETNIPTHTPTIDEVIITYIKYKLPTIQLFSPNGGEDLIKGEGHVITWTAEGDLPSNPISLYYSTNGGDSWLTIAENISNTGYYNWTVPNINTSIALVKVICRDIYGDTVSDVSDITFTIDPPPFYGVRNTEYNADNSENENNVLDTKIFIISGSGAIIAIIAGIALIYYIRRREEE